MDLIFSSSGTLLKLTFLTLLDKQFHRDKYQFVILPNYSVKSSRCYHWEFKKTCPFNRLKSLGRQLLLIKIFWYELLLSAFFLIDDDFTDQRWKEEWQWSEGNRKCGCWLWPLFLTQGGRVGGGNIVNRMRKPRVTLINNRIAANSSIEKSSSYVQRSMCRKCCV